MVGQRFFSRQGTGRPRGHYAALRTPPAALADTASKTAGIATAPLTPPDFTLRVLKPQPTLSWYGLKDQAMDQPRPRQPAVVPVPPRPRPRRRYQFPGPSPY